MKSKILLFSGLVCVLFTNAQRSTTAFAVTSNSKGTFNWTELRQIDLETGKLIRNVYESSMQDYAVFNARTKAKIQVKDKDGNLIDHMHLPFGGLSAACAYDRKNERLYFSPIFRNELRYIDLKGKSPKFYYYSDEPLMNVKDPAAESNHITRMVIAANGKGYALSNDAMHLVEFNTNKGSGITDLGALKDDASNNGVSIHERNSSWGGDLIADEEGALYLFSANKHVFKIDPKTMTATFIGKVNGIPAEYTTNGAVVDDEGNVILSSANNSMTYYRVDMIELNATSIKQSEGNVVYNCSDLANGNVLKIKKGPVPVLLSREELKPGLVSVYPNPVLGDNLRIYFNEQLNGRFELQLLDGKGVKAFQRSIVVHGNNRVIDVPIPSVAKGAYIINILGNGRKVGAEILVRQ